MNKSLLLYALLFSSLSQAGGFRFPTVEFTYAKLYFFNLNLNQPNLMDFRIYEHGEYAASKIGQGFTLSDEFHQKVLMTLKNGIDELSIGLAKCYMPRHGIIYYNEQHEPVASLSICFECDKISIWSLHPYTFSDDYHHFNYKKAEKQMASLSEIIRAEGIPVYYSPDDVENYWTFESSTTQRAGLVHSTFEFDRKLPFLGSTSIDSTSTWLNVEEANHFSSVKDTTISRHDKTYNCQCVHYKNLGLFYFVNKELIEANWSTTAIRLPLGLQIGMSWEEITNKSSENREEKSTSPDSVTLSYWDWDATLYFEFATLQSVQLHATK